MVPTNSSEFLRIPNVRVRTPYVSILGTKYFNRRTRLQNWLTSIWLKIVHDTTHDSNKKYVNLTWHSHFSLLKSINNYINQYLSIFVLLLPCSSIFRSNPTLILASPIGTTISSAELCLSSSKAILSIFFLSGQPTKYQIFHFQISCHNYFCQNVQS